MTEVSVNDHDNDRPRQKLEHDLLEKILTETLKEQKRNRRWGIAFKLFFAFYLVAILVVFKLDSVTESVGKHSALIELSGVIGGLTGIKPDDLIRSINSAFSNDDVQGIILRINSPGGSPAQAGYINSEINRLRTKYPDKSIYSVVTDICASGGYYVAVGTEKIFVDKASIVGSFGVLIDGFGFVKTLEKLGVERRLITAGEHKAILDPFSPQTEQDVSHARQMLDQIHRQFIDVVKKGRGEKLSSDEQIFSGLFWTGEKAVQLGLVDEIGNAKYVAREVIGAEKIVDYSPRESLLERISQEIGVVIVKTLNLDNSEFRLH